MPDHRPGRLTSSPYGFTVVLTEELSPCLRAVRPPAATSRSPACASPSPGVLLFLALQQPFFQLPPTGRVGGMPRLVTQKVLFQKENCKAGGPLAALSTYVCAPAAGRVCYQGKGRGTIRL